MNERNAVAGLITDLMRRVNRLEARDAAERVYLQAPKTSTSWDGDARSTTAKTLIDLSVVFGAPDGVRAVLVRLLARDSGSAAGTNLEIGLSPNNTASSFPLSTRVGGAPNDVWREASGWIPCNTDGDIYYQVTASGSGTMDVILEIWGWEY